VEDRWFAVIDTVGGSSGDHVYTFRLSGYAGHGVGGTFELRVDGARWERANAGVDVYVGSPSSSLTVAEPPFVENEVPHVHQLALDREVNSHGVMDAVVEGELPQFITVLAPYKVGVTDGDEAPLTVTRTADGWQVGDHVIERDGSDIALSKGGAEQLRVRTGD